MDTKAYETNYEPRDTHILTRRGEREPINQPLIKPFGKPRGGWYVVITIAGIPERVNDTSAFRVYHNVRNALKVNNQKVSDVDLWFNLNLQWYARLAPKYMLVSYKDLLANVVSSDRPKSQDNPAVRRYTPESWGSKAWDWMGINLARNTYAWSNFFALLKEVQDMLNNDVNPAIGCNECYIEFTKEIDVLRQNPKHTVEEARQWLTDFHNTVNKRLNKTLYSYEYASERYLWK